MEEYTKYKVESEILKKKMRESASETFKTCSKGLFDKYPELKSYGWQQYTPYFNDGDECLFGVQSNYPKINEIDSDEIYDEADDNINWDPCIKDITNLIQMFDTNDLKDMFGDHVGITVTRDDITVSEIDHD